MNHERCGWRDQSISARHRIWGFNCPAVDLDFLMVEYNVGKPVGLIEYKFHLAQTPNLLHPTYRALTAMADVAQLPFLLAYYWRDVWAFRVTPVNQIAKQWFEPDQMLTERKFVATLYRMRRLVLTRELEGKLNDRLPETQRPAGEQC